MFLVSETLKGFWNIFFILQMYKEAESNAKEVARFAPSVENQAGSCKIGYNFR